MCEVQIVDYNDKLLSLDDVKERIQDLRNSILEHSDLKKLRSDDAFLLRFLHRTRFDVARAYESVKKHYKYVTEEKDWIAVDVSDNVETFLNMNMRVMLPAVDKDGKKIFYMRTDTVDPSKITMAEINQLEYIWLESVLDDPKVQAHGLCILVDVSGFSWKLVNWFTPTNIKRGIRRLESITVRDATIHIIRSTFFMKPAVNLIWPLLPNKIKQRIKFHFNDFNSLSEHISVDNLPKEYGGNLEVNFEALNTELLSRSEEIKGKLEHYKLICV